MPMDAAFPFSEFSQPLTTESGEAAVRCTLCSHLCVLADGERGFCRARVAQQGRIVDENYGRVTSLALDPIEKKPLVRFHAGSFVLSVGSYGCNLDCPFCQNASIAAACADYVSWHAITPEALVSLALDQRERGNIGIAYTYNEPLVGYEFVRDCATLAHEAGLVNVLVSNGMVNARPLKELLPLIDAANIDLKGFTDEFYRWVGGDFSCVKRSIEALASCPSCHLEVTTLVIPEMNDADSEIEAASSWLASLSPDIPYHLSRFHPCHRLCDRPPTPRETIYRLVEVARRHLTYVYAGNC